MEDGRFAGRRRAGRRAESRLLHRGQRQSPVRWDIWWQYSRLGH